MSRTISPELTRVLNSINRLRPLPANVTRILRALDDPSTTASILADLISLDQALVAYLLSMANSARLGYTGTCVNLKEAVMRLGFKQVRALVFSTVASGPLTRRLSGYRLGNGVLWEHSLSTAENARWLAQALYYPMPEEAYVAGLLHDIGKLLLDQFVLEDYQQIVETMWRKKLYLWQVEEEKFGIDHARVGGLMAQQWGFPQPLIDAIAYHHAPAQSASNQKLAALVNLANAFNEDETMQLSSLGGRVIHPGALPILSLDETRLVRMRAVRQASISRDATERIQPPAQSQNWF